MPETSREEHLQWCKDRALAYALEGNPKEAITSMLSDLTKHPETKGANESLAGLAIMMLGSGEFNNYDSLARFINGFN